MVEDFQLALEQGGEESVTKGSGRAYMAVVERRVVNQEFGMWCRRMWRPWRWRGLEGPSIEEAELAEVEDGEGWYCAREEGHGWGGGPRVEPLESLQGSPVVELEGVELAPVELEGGEAGVHPRGAVECLYPKGGSGVAPMAPGEPTGGHGVEGLPMSREAACEGGQVATTGAPEYSNVLGSARSCGVGGVAGAGAAPAAAATMVAASRSAAACATWAGTWGKGEGLRDMRGCGGWCSSCGRGCGGWQGL